MIVPRGVVFEGALKPCQIDLGKRGYSALVFDYQEARHFIQSREAEELHGFTVQDATAMLGLREEVVYDLIDAGLLQARATRQKNGAVTVIPAAAMEAFKSEYVTG